MMHHGNPVQIHLASILAGTVALISLPSVAHAQDLSVSPYFSSYAVIQRDAAIRVWGESEPGDHIAAEFNGQSAKATADDDGQWTLDFPAMKAGGPYTLTITDGEETVTSKNILVGDVWVCSGQSNMGFRIENDIRGAEAIANANNNQFRLMQINRRTSNDPINQVDSRGWRPDGPDYAGRFSAVGYFFGRQIQSELGVPVGMIESTWGGTPAEAWTPEPALRDGSDWAQNILDSIPSYDRSPEETEKLVAEYEAKHAAYIKRILTDETGLAEGWNSESYNDSDWTTFDAPQFWEPILGNIDGVVWLRKAITLTEAQASGSATLNLGMVDEYDDTYVNGVRVGGLNYPSPGAGRKERSYTVPADVLRAGENVIAIRVVDTRSAGGFGSMADAMHLETSNGFLPLAGTWKAKVSHDSKALDGEFPLEGPRMVTSAQQHRRPSALYNGMIHCITGLPVKGVIWYQGESNGGRAAEYASLFPAMITAWRNAWNEHGLHGVGTDDLPFLFVQLPNYHARSEAPEESDWAELREAQTKALDLPAVGMAVAIDVGEPDDIHPRNKYPVGQRLAAIAMADVYGKSDPTAHSPSFAAASASSDGVVTVELDSAKGLHTTDGARPKGFSLAGDDGVFIWAEAEIAGDSIRIWSPNIPDPVEIRYAWAWNPETNIVNVGDKPMAPFRAKLREGHEHGTH